MREVLDSIPRHTRKEKKKGIYSLTFWRLKVLNQAVSRMIPLGGSEGDSVSNLSPSS